MGVNLGTAVGYLELDTSKFTMGFKNALSSVEKFKKGTGGVSGMLKGVSNGLASTGKDITLKVTAPIAGLGAAAVKTSASFESSLSKVKAISGATGKDMVDLKAKAIEMGAKTKFSATEAADAFTYMAMAGWDTKSMMDGIDGIMNLAAADGLDLATTSDIVTDALTAFGKSAGDAGTLADVLAKASSSANTNVSMMGESFKYVAPVAGSLKYSFQDVGIALGIMANGSVKASQAGTSLRAALTRMIKPTDEVEEAMKRYHISLQNTDGTMKPLGEVMDTLRNNLGGLSDAEKTQAAATIFGQEAMAGMLNIINASEEDYNNLTNEVNNSKGAAKSMADEMQNNLNGQLTLLKSNIDTLAISIGDLIIPYIEKVVAKIQQLVTYLNGLDDQTKENIIRVAAVVAAVGPALLVLAKVVSIVSTVMQVLKVLATIIGLIASPIGIVVAAIGALVAAFVILWNKSEAFRNFWKGLWDNVKKIAKTVVDTIVKFFTETLPNGLKNAQNKIKEFPSNVVKFFKNLPKNIGRIVGEVLGTIVKWAINLQKKGTEAGRKFNEALINFIKKLPSRIATFLKNVISKVVTFVKEFPKKAREASKKFNDMLLNGLKKLPGKMLEIGKNIIDGIVNGIKKAWSSAKKAVSDFAGGLVDGFKDALGIHSPSRVMRDQVGVQIANGIIEGVKSKKDAAKKSASELSQEIVDAASKRLDKLQTYNKITTAQEVDFWKKIYQSTKKGTDANLTAYKNYKSAQQSLNQEILSDAEKKLDKLKTYNKISVAGEVAYWDDVRSKLKKGSDEYLTAYKNYIEAKKSYNEELKTLEDDYNTKTAEIYDNLKTKVDELTKAYNDQVKSRKEALLSTFKLFDEYEVSSDKNGEDLTNSLQSQVNALQKFNDQMSALEGRNILPDDLVTELRNQGVAATGELEALNALTDEKLQQYVDLWTQRNQLAQQEAERENKEAYDKLQHDIEEANETALEKLDKLKTKYGKKLKKMKAEVYDAAKIAGKKTGQGIVDGLNTKSLEIDKTLQSISNKISSYMDQISSSLSSARSSADEVEKLANSSNSATSSHRQGLTYVPYDGYKAILHEGERVLTKEEARSRVTGDTFIFNSPKAIDEREAARQMKLAKKQLAMDY